METRKITIPIDPVGKGRPRFTRNGHAYTPAKTVAAELIIGTYARHQWKDEPLKQQVNARMTFFMPIPKGVAKKYLADFQSEKLGHLKRPDLDNMVKLLADALNGIIWADDSQIFNLHACKLYSANPRIELEIFY